MATKNVWFKSTRSGGVNENCVEVMLVNSSNDCAVYVRDTKARECGLLSVSAGSWKSLVAVAKEGCLDLPI
jgi:hypothetical protein